MNKSKAAFRAMRETIGITQQGLADLVGVKILSVKRWESPKYPQQSPDAVWDLLHELESEQIHTCHNALAVASKRLQNSTEDRECIEVPYWSSAADYESSRGSEELTWTEANANSRRLAVLLEDRGVSVQWVDGTTCANPII